MAALLTVAQAGRIAPRDAGMRPAKPHAITRASPVSNAKSSVSVRLGQARRGTKGGFRVRAEPERTNTVEEAVRELEKGSPEGGKDEEQEMDPTTGTIKLSRAAVVKKITVKDVSNPLQLGRKSRQLFDDVWTRVNQLTGIMSSGNQVDEEIDRVLIGGETCSFETPQAGYTTVLVVGVTGRVGRILVRKLLLRGYTVRALVREGKDNLEGIPRAVEIIMGDVGDPVVCAAAMKGCNKVVYAAGARTTATADLYRVEQQGIYNITKAMQDLFHTAAQKRAGKSFKSKRTLFRFHNEGTLDAWETESSTTVPIGAMTMGVGTAARDFVDVAINAEKGKGAVFTANLYSRNSRGEMFTTFDDKLSSDFPRYDGFVMRVCGDGKPYSVNLYCSVEEDGLETERVYSSRFNTRAGWQTLRVPFSNFIPKVPGDPKMDTRTVRQFSIAYDARRLARTADTTMEEEADSNKARLEVHFVKLVPRGDEPDFLLVSCTGTRDVELSETDKEKLLDYKGRGEGVLRNSGLGYTIIRPGSLTEGPGGQKALVFDQGGGRISQNISCADVADVCLKGLHDPTARNKSFDVCQEYISDEGSLYELIAHLPDKSNNYLTSALSRLDSNT